MGRKGRVNQQKRISMPKSIMGTRKTLTWILKGSPGPHTLSKSVPLGVVLRDMLNVVSNKREVSFALSRRKVKVDGVVKQRRKLPIGLFDSISIDDIKLNALMLVDNKGRILAAENPTPKIKLCRIERKNSLPKGFIQLTMHDGKNLRIPVKDKDNYAIGDSIELEVPSGKIKRVLKFEKGSNILMVTGKHTGETGVVSEVIPGARNKAAEVKIKTSQGELQTLKSKAFVIDKPIVVKPIKVSV